MAQQDYVTGDVTISHQTSADNLSQIMTKFGSLQPTYAAVHALQHLSHYAIGVAQEWAVHPLHQTQEVPIDHPE